VTDPPVIFVSGAAAPEPMVSSAGLVVAARMRVTVASGSLLTRTRAPFPVTVISSAPEAAPEDSIAAP